MVRECAHDECATLTMGRYCLEHELLMAAGPPQPKVALTVDTVTSSAADQELTRSVAAAVPAP
jgi:hypothetical protein